MTKVNCDCGAVYSEEQKKLPLRDKDVSKCEFCGAILRRWNGGVMYIHKLISPPKEQNTKQ